ncbi:hypothetical protein [Georgenia sp. Z1491]|uniref:hypothetical protein n=1 Tax=Georgenia sp. Z1491 TaxID=3416707 RepID=UPI003CEABD6B
MSHDATTVGSTRPERVAEASPLTGVPSALSPDTAWMLPPAELVTDVESAFTGAPRTTPPPYGGLRYTASWWAARAGH